MDGYDGGRQLLADFASPRTEEAIAAARDDPGLPLTPCDGEDYDDLYGDVSVGFIPLLPLSPSPAPTSPPKTPSPGQSIQFPPRSPHRLPPLEPLPAPAPQREPKPQPQPTPENPRHQQPQPLPPVPIHHMTPSQPQRPARGAGGASYSSPPRRTSLYISELHWWTTDAEVEAALALGPAPHGAAAALHSVYFYYEKFTGKSRGICRADFLHPAAAAAAATALHGHAFHGRQCVASLARPPALHRLGDDSDSDSYAEAAPSPNPTGGLGSGGRGASDATAVRGNVAPALGDRPPLAQPQLSVVHRPSPSQPFAGILGAVGGYGYGGFQSMGQYNAGMGNVMMSSALAHHFGASGMAMRGSGVWHDQGMPGSIWGAQHKWNFRGCQMPWQQRTAPRQHQQVQQQFGNGNYGKQGHGLRRERLSNKREERSIGNVRYLDRWQVDRDGGDCYKENDREKGRHQEHILDKGREQEALESEGSSWW